MIVMNEGIYYKISKINKKSGIMAPNLFCECSEPTVMTEIMHGGRQGAGLHVNSSKVTVSAKKIIICRRASSICVGGFGPLPSSVSSLLASKPPNTKPNPLSLQASCDHVLPLWKRYTARYIVM